MGLLDDAIREHLELKRRAGEDAQRLAQLEHEAFGPIRRGDPALDLQPPGAASATPDAVDEPAAEPAWQDEAPQAAEPAWEEPAAAPEPPPAPPEPVADAPSPYEPPRTPAAESAPPRVEDALPPSPPAPEPVAPEPVEPPAAVDQPTAAYSLSDLEELGGEQQPSLLEDPPAVPAHEEPEPTQVLPPEDIVPADDEPGEHDVLEETPDFLEETPEHDRLWFEQKPPRDFDF